MKNEPLLFDFTKELGIKVQTDQLNRWKSVLMPDVFDKLQKIVTKDNNDAVNGHDVLRGSRIDEIIFNQLMN
jgi:hypothetical protein